MIKPLRLEALNDVLSLDKLALHSNWQAHDYQTEILNQNNLALALDLEGEIWGFLIARQSFSDAELLQIMVHPDKQGYDYGQALMEAARKELRLRAVKDFHLEVRASNLKAIKFYRKLGFIEVRRRLNYYGLKDHALVMRKRLVE